MLFEGGSNVIKQEVEYIDGIESIGNNVVLKNQIDYDVMKNFTYTNAQNSIYTDEETITFDFDKGINYNTWVSINNPLKDIEFDKVYTAIIPILENTKSGAGVMATLNWTIVGSSNATMSNT